MPFRFIEQLDREADAHDGCALVWRAENELGVVRSKAVSPLVCDIGGCT